MNFWIYTYPKSFRKLKLNPHPKTGTKSIKLDPDLTVSIKTKTRRANTGFVLEIRVTHEWRKRRGAWIFDALLQP
jgi:hypothetical protein